METSLFSALTEANTIFISEGRFTGGLGKVGVMENNAYKQMGGVVLILLVGRGTNGKVPSCSRTFTRLAARMNCSSYHHDLDVFANANSFFEVTSEPVENTFLHTTQFGCISSDPAANPYYKHVFQLCRIVHDIRRKQP